MQKYKQIEKELIEKFRFAGEKDDIEQMQLMAETLSRYQNYQMCVDAYIQEAIKQLELNEHIFSQINELIEQKRGILNLYQNVIYGSTALRV